MNGLKLRSSQGCWTCRLRRKKCDEARPVCTACDGLQIECHYSGDKPVWMDGGSREKQMADELKQKVKQKASERREKKWGLFSDPTNLTTTATTVTSPHVQAQAQQQRQEQEEQDPQSSDCLMSDDGPSEGDQPSTVPSDALSWQESASTSASSINDDGGSNASASAAASALAAFSSSWTEGGQDLGEVPNSAIDAFPDNRSEVEVNFTMIYLDCVMPYLFPFYRPRLFEMSRGWMLVLLMKNRALFHTALSLASWLFAVLLTGPEYSLPNAHQACRNVNWAELQAHQATAIRALQEDVRALGERGGVAAAFREGLACLQSVVQLLEFEVATATVSAAGWRVHHDAAVALFDQLIVHHASPVDRDGRPTTPWASILDRVGLPHRAIPLRDGSAILNSDQSAYVFYTAQLLWIDVVAATSKGEPPLLRAYHDELLRSDSTRICLSNYVGCHNWVVIEIAEIAELAAWKRAQQAAGSLSMIDLVRRSCKIEERLRAHLENLPVHSRPLSRPSPPFPGATPSICPSDFYDPSAHHPSTAYLGSQDATPAVNLHTRIWAQAAVTYLHVIASGLQPALPEIRASVEATIDLLRTLPSALALRTLVWPFAVTGCLAQPEHETFFVGIAEAMAELQILGTVREALAIMRSVWQHRAGSCVDPQMWDIATCFSVLGRCSLLV